MTRNTNYPRTFSAKQHRKATQESAWWLVACLVFFTIMGLLLGQSGINQLDARATAYASTK